MTDAPHIAANDIRAVILRSAGFSVRILNLGGITQDWRVPLNGTEIPIVLGFQRPVDYLNNPHAMGVIAGRVANRISAGHFAIGDETFQVSQNENGSCLHGGHFGIGRQLWDIHHQTQNTVELRHHSIAGAQGFPGAVDFALSVTLNGATLDYKMTATPDRPTPINLAQHSYYNLMGGGTILDHDLLVPSTQITPTDADLLPMGIIADLGDKILLKGQRVHDILNKGATLDTNFVLRPNPDTIILSAPNGLSLLMETDQPCLQVYTGGKLSQGHPLWPGQSGCPNSGICLEPQAYPDALNHAAFPDTISSPDAPYSQHLRLTISGADA